MSFGLRPEKLKPSRPCPLMLWCLTQILSGGHNWTKILVLAKTLVNVRGGPETLLSRSAADEPGFGTSNGVFRTKLMLETLAVYDIFGVYTHGRGGYTHHPLHQASLFLRAKG